MDHGDQGDHGTGCWTRSTVVLFLHFVDADVPEPVAATPAAPHQSLQPTAALCAIL